MKLKQHFRKELFKDWKFWYKFLFGLAILIVILQTWITSMIQVNNVQNEITQWINQQETMPTFEQIHEQLKDTKFLAWISLNPIFGEGGLQVKWNVGANFGDLTINTFTYFTALSNIAVGIWFLIAAFKPQNEGQKGYLSNTMTITILTYITITAIIWHTFLLPVQLMAQIGKPGLAESLAYGFTQHLIFPLSIILYIAFIFVPKNMFTSKYYIKNHMWKAIIVLFIYTGVMLIRGEIRYQGNKPSHLYPYFFLDVHHSTFGIPGIAWFFIITIVITSIVIGFSILYTRTLYNKENKVKVVKVNKH